MARKVSTKPEDVSLSKSIDSRLKFYGMAAAAASVGLLALVEPVEGKVVITNKNIPIPLCSLHACPVKLDLNRDGIADFSFTLGTYGYGQNVNGQLHVNPLAGGEAMGAGSLAFALVRGAKIGPSAQFASFEGLIVERSSQCTYGCGGDYQHNFEGNWGGNHPNRFLGVKFLIHGKTHYGWVRITVTTNPSSPMSAEITEYGYETIANKSCGAGLSSQSAVANDISETNEQRSGKDSPSLGMLALGADALPLWRRDDWVNPVNNKFYVLSR